MEHEGLRDWLCLPTPQLDYPATDHHAGSHKGRILGGRQLSIKVAHKNSECTVITENKFIIDSEHAQRSTRSTSLG